MKAYMRQFINHSLASQFKKAIPALKKQLGQKPLHSDDATFGVAGNAINRRKSDKSYFGTAGYTARVNKCE